MAERLSNLLANDALDPQAKTPEFKAGAVRPGPMGPGEVEYGIVLTAMAIGGPPGSVVCERLQKGPGRRNALPLDFVCTILPVGVPALTTNPFVLQH